MPHPLPVLGSCDGCRFWVRDDDVKGIGQCHRYAPRPVPHRDGQALAAPSEVRWPTTYDTDCCGEWLPQPAPEAQP